MPTADYALGLCFIVLVALIWAASSVLVQYLYTSDEVSFHSPFLLTYIGVSLFTLWLPTNLIWTTWFSDKPRHTINTNTGISFQNSGGMELAPSAAATTQVAYQTVPNMDYNHDEDGDDDEDDNNNNNNNRQWTHADHRHAALKIAPVWFLANWTYNASLAYTSITSSTVLASTGSLFTFLFAVCTQDETFHYCKLLGVLFGVLGSLLTAWQDHEGGTGEGMASNSTGVTAAIIAAASDDDNGNTYSWALFGDLLGLCSAVGYGAYAVQTRLLCPHNEALYSMEVLLGYIGLFNMVALSPVAVYSLCVSPAGDQLTWLVFGFLVVKGLFDNVLSDYLWLRAVILTNATVATVGLGLTIPLAFASDVILGKVTHVLSAGSICGALAVLLGFCLVNVGNAEKEEEEVEESLPNEGTDGGIEEEEGGVAA